MVSPGSWLSGAGVGLVLPDSLPLPDSLVA